MHDDYELPNSTLKLAVNLALQARWDAIDEGFLTPDFSLLFCERTSKSIQAFAKVASETINDKFNVFSDSKPQIDAFKKSGGAIQAELRSRIQELQDGVVCNEKRTDTAKAARAGEALEK